jgi:hypothetical protein
MKKPPRTITEEDKEKLERIIAFARTGELGLMVCKHKKSRKEVIVVAGKWESEGKVFMYPITILPDGDLFAELTPPDGAEPHEGGKIDG